MRQRLAARQRLLMLRDALGIVQTVREPARVLEREGASLSAGIDATVALVASATNAAPPTLGAAAAAVRFGLAEMSGSKAVFDATFAAAQETATDDQTEAECVAQILAMQAQIDKRDATVRAFIQPSLVALRDTRSAAGTGQTGSLRDLVNDQFQRIEATVAILASMRDAVARATTILRDLPLEETKLAA